MVDYRHLATLTLPLNGGCGDYRFFGLLLQLRERIVRKEQVHYSFFFVCLRVMHRKRAFFKCCALQKVRDIVGPQQLYPHALHKVQNDFPFFSATQTGICNFSIYGFPCPE